MDPGSDSSPIVILASFLIFLSYIYHKVWQPRHRSFEEEKIHEKYTLQDHYVSSTPQIRTITPEEFPYFHSDEAFNRKATRQQYYREMRPENLAYNRFNNQNRQEYQPSNNFPDEPLSPNSEGWPSREHDLLNLSENLSAIPNTTRNNIPSMSPNNSFFDNSIANQLRNAEPNREEYIPSNLIDTEATRRRDYNSSRPSFQKGVGMRGVGTENQKQVGNMKRNARRAHIYHDSSDTDTEMREISPIERKNSRPQDNEERVRNYNTIREVPAQLEKTLSKPKEAMQVEESRLESNNKLNETNYEPEIRKKRQVISAKPNGYSRVRPEDSGIRVQEIFEGFGEKRPEKHIKGTTNADVKNENGSKKVKNGLPAKADTLNKNQNPEDLDQKSRQKLAAALRKKLKEKKYGIDLSSLNEKSSNLNLQKYVAKKTVQEQAFRISALPSTAESGKTSVSTGSLNLGINKDDAKPGSDLFKTMGPGKSDLFQQKDAKAPAPNAPTLEKKDSVAPAAQAQPGENKGGLFSNLPGLANKEEKKENPPAAPAQTNNTQTEAVPKPLIFGSAGLFAADENVPVQNPILVTRNQSIVPGAGEEPQLAKKDSAFPQTSSLFSQSSGKSLFANTTKALSGDQSKSVAESLFGKSGETKAEAPTKSFFSNFNSAPTEQKPAPEQKSTGLFASLGGLHAVPPATEDKSKQNTAAPQSQSQSQPQPQSEAPAENNSSIFSASSIFGGQSKPPPPPGQPLKKDDIRPTTVTDVPGASYTASLLFGPPDPNNSIPSPAPFPVQTQPAQTQAPQGNQGGGNLFSGFSGGNLLNQISSGSKANEGSSSSIFARFGQQASPPKGQTQGQNQNQSQAQGQGQGQTPSQTQAPAQTGTGSIFSNLMASKQQSNMNMGGTMFSPKKDGQTGQSSNSLFGNQSASTQENKPTLFGNLFANANANTNAGGNMGGNTGNAQVSSGSGTSAGMFANIFNKGGNQGSSAPSLFRNS